MATRILVFNPLNKQQVEEMEARLDGFLFSGWQLVGTVGGRHQRASDAQGGPWGDMIGLTLADYVVLILHTSKYFQGALNEAKDGRNPDIP